MAVDDADRGERDLDRARVEALRLKAIHEILHVEAGQVGEPVAPELGQDPEPQRPLVAADGARLVGVPGAIADGACLGSLKELLGGLGERDFRRRS